MKEKILLYAKKMIIFLIALMSLLSLGFVFFKGTMVLNSGLETANTSIIIKGFDLLLNSEFAKGIAINPTNIYSGSGITRMYADMLLTVNPKVLMILVVSICLLVLSVANFFMKDNKIEIVIIVVALIMVIMYMSSSFVWLEYALDVVDKKYSNIFTTASYIPLIIEFVFVAGYVALEKFSKYETVNTEKASLKEFPKASAKEKVDTISSDYISEIKQIKELLDMGAITQEEFDTKKKEILSL